MEMSFSHVVVYDVSIQPAVPFSLMKVWLTSSWRTIPIFLSSLPTFSNTGMFPNKILAHLISSGNLLLRGFKLIHSSEEFTFLTLHFSPLTLSWIHPNQVFEPQLHWNCSCQQIPRLLNWKIKLLHILVALPAVFDTVHHSLFFKLKGWQDILNCNLFIQLLLTFSI